MDGIIGELIGHGADVNAMGGCTIYNAICAASFAADVSIINLLLKKGASVQERDPLGRYPIRFAAANGAKNLEALALVHRGGSFGLRLRWQECSALGCPVRQHEDN